MTDHPVPPDRHRHAHRPARTDRRRPVLLAAVSALVVAAVVTALLLASWDGPEDAATAERAVATPVASTSPGAPPSSLPVTAPAATTAEAAAPTPEVPQEFADAVQRIGIPLDPHTGWVLAEGICVRLGQPEYDQFRMAEGVERLFPSVSDDQAHEFVAMVAESVCGM
ncbi:hypothetical protein SAMN04488107_2497 [Geodermatophilus saharensis]|uniref:DUF732 domain-containing protein n=1 Tax=Geodermatophilus saharensis TaxID=1137994 RepID=A0A239ECM5_9ACTN|nr:hypothetical protein [Geodermatophilus saharensis]SNS42520.1 hypothetical protein SAMN04488107_2497 [Geodermatophilus saharensis]